MDKLNCGASCMSGIVAAASLVSAFMLSSAVAAPAANDEEAQAREAWREVIVRTDVPEGACFHASYPRTEWVKVECGVAPKVPFTPRTGTSSRTVGNGVDFVAETSALSIRSVGTFLQKRITSVTGPLGANDYSIQLNSNFMTTAACNGVPGCQTWEQFVYSSGYESAFMQYWLIDYGASCPGGWTAYGSSCYINSAAVSVPSQPITELNYLKLSGKAVAGGLDTLIFTTETDAYSTTGEDSVLDLATAWYQTEVNVVGDGLGAKAVFNLGTIIKVIIATRDGSSNAPTCVLDAGTTGETNNLGLRGCKTRGGTVPDISYIESN